MRSLSFYRHRCVLKVCADCYKQTWPSADCYEITTKDVQHHHRAMQIFRPRASARTVLKLLVFSSRIFLRDLLFPVRSHNSQGILRNLSTGFCLEDLPRPLGQPGISFDFSNTEASKAIEDIDQRARTCFIYANCIFVLFEQYQFLVKLLEKWNRRAFSFHELWVKQLRNTTQGEGTGRFVRRTSKGPTQSSGCPLYLGLGLYSKIGVKFLQKKMQNFIHFLTN